MKIPIAELVARLRSAPIDYAAAQLMESAANRIEELEAAGPVAQEPRTIPCPVCEEGTCYESRHFSCLQCGADLADPEQAKANKQAVIAARKAAQPAPAQGERSDTERLNWLVQNEYQVWEVNDRYSVRAVTEAAALSQEYPSARAAIDAAMK